jgi:ABC-type phosphate transport system substrate-binding protein
MNRYVLVVAVSFALALRSGTAPAAEPMPAAANDAVAIVVNRANPVDELTLSELRRIFMFDTQTWEHGRKITVVLREKGQPERAEAIRLFCGISEEQYDRHVLFQTFRGTIGQGPREILSASAMLRFVFNAPGAIGYVNADELDGSTKVLRIDGMAPAHPRYPLSRKPRRGGRAQN